MILVKAGELHNLCNQSAAHTGTARVHDSRNRPAKGPGETKLGQNCCMARDDYHRGRFGAAEQPEQGVSSLSVGRFGNYGRW